MRGADRRKRGGQIPTFEIQPPGDEALVSAQQGDEPAAAADFEFVENRKDVLFHGRQT
jgi:hypothetical protein